MNLLIEQHTTDTRLGSVATTFDLARGLTRRGHTVTYAVPDDVSPGFTEMSKAIGCKVVTSESMSFARSSFIQYALDVRKKKRLLTQLSVDALFQNYIGWGQTFANAAKKLSIPAFSRAGGEFSSNNPSNKLITSYLAYNSFHARSLLDSPLKHKVEVTGHPFDVEHFYSLDSQLGFERNNIQAVDKECIFLFMGQLTERKGLEILVRAFSALNGNSQLLLVGGNWQQSDYGQTIIDLITKLKMKDRIICMDHQQNSYSLLNMCDVFVLPSLEDTQPRVVFEAMAMKKPVIVTDSGGSVEVVKNKVNGLVVPPSDPEALMSAMQILASNEIVRGAMGQRAFDDMKTRAHSSEVIANYERVLFSRRSS